MMWFGERGDAPVYEDTEEAPVPVGEQCLACPEEIREGESGFLIPWAKTGEHFPYHRKCFLQSVGVA